MKTKDQITIFDEIELQENETEYTEFHLKDEVKIKKLEYIQHEVFLEDVHILETYGGKKGKVISVHNGKEKSYEIEFDNGEKHYFYSKELILLG